MNKDTLRIRGLFVAVATMLTALFVGMATSPALAADGGTYNNVEINITGGNANALSLCVNYAKQKAKKGEAAQSNACKNFAKAEGGNVKLKKVNIDILQAGSGDTSKNNVNVNISAGDATAVAACVNYLQGTADADQTNKCKNNAVAVGGDVNLKNVNITILQG